MIVRVISYRLVIGHPQRKGDIQTDEHTHEHGNLKTESA